MRSLLSVLKVRTFFVAAFVFAGLQLAACGGGGGSGGGTNNANSFSFAARNGVATNVLLKSEKITLSGLVAPSAISIVNGEYIIDGANWTTAAGTISNGQSVTVRHTTAATNSTTTTTTLTIGARSASFVSVTVAAGMLAVVSQGGLNWIPDNNYTADTWQAANTTCTTSTINGQTGWRLPTAAELAALNTSGAAQNQGWAMAGIWSANADGAGYHDYVSMSGSNTQPIQFPDAGPVNFSCVHT